MEEHEFDKLLKKMLKEKLEVRVNRECGGHMSGYEKKVAIYYDNELISEQTVMEEYHDGDNWEWR